MAETNMPATEAAVASADEAEQNSYELAFHILPTVAEGEVPDVFEAIKTLITDADGELFDEEAPERVDLAYDIVQHVEGKNHKFRSAYFGWVRFRAAGTALANLTEHIESRGDILRHLLIKLTKIEEMHPFRFHEAQKERKVSEVEEREVVAPKEQKPVESVSDDALDKSLDKITDDSDVKAEKKEDNKE